MGTRSRVSGCLSRSVAFGKTPPIAKFSHPFPPVGLHLRIRFRRPYKVRQAQRQAWRQFWMAELAYSVYCLPRMPPGVARKITIKASHPTSGCDRIPFPIRVKLDKPVTSCTNCKAPGYNIGLANGPCGRMVGKKRCKGTKRHRRQRLGRVSILPGYGLG